MLCHPLVSPLAVKSWAGSPPIFIETGQELLTDESKYVAMMAARQGVKVVYEEYETMPHCFAMVLEGLEASRMFFEGWAAFIMGVVYDPENVEEGGRVVKPKTLEVRSVDVKGLSRRSGDEVRRAMRERVKAMSGEVPDPMAKL